MVLSPLRLADPAALPMLGREAETEALSATLARAERGEGAAVLLEGAGGLGKTRLSRWMQATAESRGFHVASGYCLKEVLAPFFPWEQVFRSLEGLLSGRQGHEAGSDPVVRIFLEKHPEGIWHDADRLGDGRAVLVISREGPSTLKRRFSPSLRTARALWLSRGEGEGVVSPADLDGLGERISGHFRSARGSVVALTGLEYLVSQRDFVSVLRLVQFSRDVAEATKGRLLLSLNPSNFEPRQLSLLEQEGELIDGPAPSPSPGEARSDPPADVMMRYLALLERSSKLRPTLLAVDDLQWADPASCRTFQFLARNVRRLPVVVLATLRDDPSRSPSEVSESPLSEVLDSLDREGELQRLTLRPVSPATSRRLLEGFLGVAPAGLGNDPELDRLLTRAEGNPYLLLSTMRLLVDEGRLEKVGGRLQVLATDSEEGAHDGGSIPAAVRRSVEAQLALLPAWDRSFLQIAAVLGKEFELDPVVALSSPPLPDVPEVLARLQAGQRFIHRTKGTAERYSFTHALTWEAILADIPPEQRRRTALLLADWHASHRSFDVELIASLYYGAKDSKRGLAWVRRALERAITGPAPEPAERLHRWWQELLGEEGVAPDQRVSAGLEVVRELVRIHGGTRPAERMVASLLALGPSQTLRWELEVWRAAILLGVDPPRGREALEAVRREMAGASTSLPVGVQVQLARADLRRASLDADPRAQLEAAERCLRLMAMGPSDPRDRGYALYVQSLSFDELDRPEEASTTLEALRSEATLSRDGRLRAYAVSRDAEIAHRKGDLPGALRAYEEILAIYRGLGHVTNVLIALENVATVLSEMGRDDRARTRLAEAREMGEKFDVPWVAAGNRRAEAEILVRQGQWSAAAAAAREALEECTRLGTLEGVPACRFVLAEAFLGDSNGREAVAELSEASKDGSDLPLLERARYHRLLSEARGLEGDLDRARQENSQAREVARRSGNRLEEGLARLQLARSVEREGDLPRARELREEAERILSECGSRFGRPG